MKKRRQLPQKFPADLSREGSYTMTITKKIQAAVKDVI